MFFKSRGSPFFVKLLALQLSKINRSAESSDFTASFQKECSKRIDAGGRDLGQGTEGGVGSAISGSGVRKVGLRGGWALSR